MPGRSALTLAGTSYVAFLVVTPLVLAVHEINWLVTAASATVTGGFLAAAALLAARRGDGPVSWLGRHTVGQLLLWLPAVFLVVPLGGFATADGLVDPIFIPLWFGLLGTAVALGHLAQRRYCQAVQSGEPLLTLEWSPRVAPDPIVRLLAVVGVVFTVVITAGHAVNGYWGQTAVWVALLAGSVIGLLGQGLGQPFGIATASQIDLYESALVFQRPLDTTAIRWTEVEHIRVRDGDLVVDNGGLIDQTITDLEAADHDRLLETVERHDLTRILES